MYNKIIRYLTLLFGIASGIIPIYMNYEGLSSLMGQIVFTFFTITPFFAYFFYSRKEKRILYLLLPAVLLCIIYALTLFSYIDSTSSTSALVFIIAPIFGFGVLIFVYLTLYLVSKFLIKDDRKNI